MKITKKEKQVINESLRKSWILGAEWAIKIFEDECIAGLRDGYSGMRYSVIFQLARELKKEIKKEIKNES